MKTEQVKASFTFQTFLIVVLSEYETFNIQFGIVTVIISNILVKY